MIKFVVALSLVGMAMGVAIPRPQDGLPTVDVDLSKYLGRWYQTYGNRFGYLIYGDAVCITATYGAINATHISVYNNNRVSAPDGDEDSIRGYGYYTGNPGKFLVQLAGVPVEATYWVVKLGPATYGAKNEYQYAVVTNESSTSLFVLSRDP